MPNTPFVAQLRVDCVGFVGTVPISLYEEIRDDVQHRLYAIPAASAAPRPSVAAVDTSDDDAASPTRFGAKRRRLLFPAGKGKGKDKAPATQTDDGSYDDEAATIAGTGSSSGEEEL